MIKLTYDCDPKSECDLCGKIKRNAKLHLIDDDANIEKEVILCSDCRCEMHDKMRMAMMIDDNPNNEGYKNLLDRSNSEKFIVH